MAIKERLKQRRLELNMTLEDVAKIVGITRQTVQKYESGVVSNIPSDKIEDLAKALKTTPAYIMGWENQSEKNPYSKFPSPNITEDYTTFPVIGEIAAGWEGYMLEPDWEGETVDIPNSYLKGRPREDFFVLRVKGDSMYPLYHENDKVLIYKQSSLDYSGQIGAIVFEDDHITLKKIEFIPGEDWLRMIAINPIYPPKRIENEELEQCRVLGIPKLLLRDIE